MASAIAPVRRLPGLPADDPHGPCYVRAAVLGPGGILRSHVTAAVLAAALVLASGCGGDDRQDAADEQATYTVEITDRSFPARQSLAEAAEMRVTIRNVDDRTIPNVAATIEMEGGGTETVAFGALSGESGLSSRSRPVWVVEDGPLSGTTAYANTWALGPLEPGDSRDFIWRVVPVEPGRYVLRYRFAGSLTGGARLETENGTPARGRFVVEIDDRPRRTRVTDDGRIVHVRTGAPR
jgi:hypothetical protein